MPAKAQQEASYPLACPSQVLHCRLTGTHRAAHEYDGTLKHKSGAEPLIGEMGGFRARSSRAPTTLASRLKMLKPDGESLIAEHKKKSLPPPDLVPHPEDIGLEPSDYEAYICGPKNEEEVPFYKHLMALRDHALLRSIHFSYGKKREAPDGEERICAYALSAHWTDYYLPPRRRWKDGELESLAFEYLRFSKRDRERRIREETDFLLRTRPEDSRLPPHVQRKLDRIMDRVFKHKGSTD